MIPDLFAGASLGQSIAMVAGGMIGTTALAVIDGAANEYSSARVEALLERRRKWRPPGDSNDAEGDAAVLGMNMKNKSFVSTEKKISSIGNILLSKMH
jgi:hypothetical protein